MSKDVIRNSIINWNIQDFWHFTYEFHCIEVCQCVGSRRILESNGKNKLKNS